MAMKRASIPQSGDVVYLENDTPMGGQEIVSSSVYVSSPAKYHVKTGLMLDCPITSKIKNYPFKVSLESVSSFKGVLLSDQTNNLDWQARKAKFTDALFATRLLKVKGKTQALLEMR